jgi:putative endonuclease
MNSKQLGDWGEKIASKYLKNKGYQILEKNYSPKFISGPKKGEIDIVAKKGGVISFVEVKTLTEDCGGPTSAISPEDKVNFLKKKKIIKMAEFWLMEKKIPLDSKWQVDIVAIRIDSNLKKAKIRYFPNISI